MGHNCSREPLWAGRKPVEEIAEPPNLHGWMALPPGTLKKPFCDGGTIMEVPLYVPAIPQQILGTIALSRLLWVGSDPDFGIFAWRSWDGTPHVPTH